MTRRKALQILLVVSVWAAFKRRGFAAQFSSIKDIEALQKNWKALLADGIKVPLPSESLKVSKDEWRKRLDPVQFAILREEGTERPSSSPLNNGKTLVQQRCRAQVYSEARPSLDVSATLRDELPFVKRPELCQTRYLREAFVLANARDPRKA